MPSHGKLVVPDGLKTLLEALGRAVVQDQPDNIQIFASSYFIELLQFREVNPTLDICDLVKMFHMSRAGNIDEKAHRAVSDDQPVKSVSKDSSLINQEIMSKILGEKAPPTTRHEASTSMSLIRNASAQQQAPTSLPPETVPQQQTVPAPQDNMARVPYIRQDVPPIPYEALMRSPYIRHEPVPIPCEPLIRAPYYQEMIPAPYDPYIRAPYFTQEPMPAPFEPMIIAPALRQEPVPLPYETLIMAQPPRQGPLPCPAPYDYMVKSTPIHQEMIRPPCTLR